MTLLILSMLMVSITLPIVAVKPFKVTGKSILKAPNGMVWTLAGSAAWLTSCALSPQTIALNPVVDVSSYPIGRGRSLALEVVDQRPSANFGVRGGVYNTAVISSRTDVAKAIRVVLADRLQRNGFTVTLPEPLAPLSMRVEIQRIDYVSGGGPAVNEIRTQAAIRAITRNGERTLTSQYQANRVRQVLTPPDEAENEILINEVVAEILQRLLRDRGVLDLLGQAESSKSAHLGAGVQGSP